MAASPFPPPSPDDVQSFSSMAKDWGTILVAAVGGFLAAIGLVWRWARGFLTANNDRIEALEEGQEALKAGHAELRNQIARLPTREEQADQFNRVNARLDRMHDVRIVE